MSGSSALKLRIDHRKLEEAIIDLLGPSEEIDNKFDIYKFTSEDIKYRLTAYKVIRNFKGKDASRFDKITDYLKQITKRTKNSKNIDGHLLVNNFLIFMIDNYKVRPLSAITKILWPFFTKEVVIYDQNAIKSLKKMGAYGIENNYYLYQHYWRYYYKQHIPVIKKVLHAHQVKCSDKVMMRLFDKYLWRDLTI